jgi:hypothetical protein
MRQQELEILKGELKKFATHHKSMATKCTLAATTTNAPDDIVN